MTTQQPHRSDDGLTQLGETGSAERTDRSRPMTQRVRGSISGGALALMLVLAACGSGDSNEVMDGGDPGKAIQTAIGDDAEEAVVAPGGGGAGGTGLGHVEIGDVRYDLTITRCTTLAGALSGGGASVSDPDNVDVTFEFPPEDWAERPKSEGWTDISTIQIDSEEPYLQWNAGPTLVEGYNLPDGLKATDLTITNVDISDDVQSVTGEAQFIEVNALFAGKDAKPTAGTFSFSCPPKN